ncbi:MAG TPA: folate-binding protein [Rhodanobacteraceae bacterium]|nr:folate-binding protein [Rhodanobacteraceae bacterium]
MIFPAISRVDCIVVEGADARRFAQAQFAGDVDALAPGHWQWNAWLDARGRVQALMHLADVAGGGLLAVLRGGDAKAIHGTLSRYLLRTRANLGVRTFTGRRGGPVPMSTVRMEADQIVLGYGTRSLRLDRDAAASDPEVQSTWRLDDIRAGWPHLPDRGPPFLPPALGLEHLGAVSFDKGCYPGQEIAARLHYLGGHKQRLCHLRGPAPLSVGEVRNADGTPNAWILAVVAVQEDTVEALAIIPGNADHEISILGTSFIIHMKFDP